MWTQFMDMHSGGGSKLDWEYIYIEAPEEEAKVIFFNRFGRNPDRVTCTCCGPDYSISTKKDLAQLTGYERGCASGYVLPDGTVKGDDWWRALSYAERSKASALFRYLEAADESRSYRSYMPLDAYMKRPDVTFIPASDIKPEERRGDIPPQDYVWVD